MDRTHVSSSNISSIGYDSKLAILEIEFNSGEIYQYFDVSIHLFNQLMSSSSKGQFLNDYIKYSYRYQKIG